MTLLALAIVLLLFTEPATAALNQWTGIRSWSTASRAATIRALALLVVVALIFALDPEVRAFLIFVDMVGVDVFLMLLFLQGQEVLRWVIVEIRAPAVRSLERWSWFPMPIPHRELFKQHPFWSLYAAAQPIALALLILVPIAALICSLGNALIMIRT